MEQLPTETSSESCSLPPTPGKGSYDNDNDTMEQFLSINDHDSDTEFTKDGVDNTPHCQTGSVVPTVQSESPMFLLNNNGAMCMEFLEDQGREDNFTDLDLICCDGYIQVHRCLLMGASKFFRDLLIDKDIMDTTAITLSDVSVRHLRQVLAILYSGRVLIDGCDEVEVFETMNLLGLPVENLLCRNAKVSDLDHTSVLRHLAGENDTEERLCVAKELKENVIESEKSTGAEVTTGMKVKDETLNKDELCIDDSVGKKGEPGDSIPVEGGHDDKEDKDDDHLQQITSTTGDSDSLIDTVPLISSDDASTPQQELKHNDYGIKAYPLNLNDGAKTVVLKSHDKSTDMGKDPAPINTTEDTDNTNERTSDDEMTDNQSSVESVSAPLPISSELDYLTFEEACKDLQMQVAKPILANVTPPSATGGGGHEMTLRKRKMNDSPENTNKVLNAGNSTNEPKNANIQQNNNKKKKQTPKTRKRAACSNGTNSANENDEDDDAELKDKQVTNQMPKGKSQDNPSQKQRRVSNQSSNTSSSEPNTETVTAQPLLPFTRVFLEVREVCGIKYNVYGYMDQDNRVESGKMIAVVASTDKINKTSSLVENN